MLVLDNLYDLDTKKKAIRIPFYHVGHLSLATKTSLTMCYLPASESDGRAMDEIVISPIIFQSWSTLWRITAEFSERQGLVSDLLSIISESDLSVLQAETVSAENSSFHHVEIIVDARMLIETDAAISEIEHIRAFERRLIAYLIQDVGIDHHDEAMLKVRKMQGLDTVYKKYLALQKSKLNPSIHETTIDKRWVSLPNAIITQALSAGNSQYLLVSDTKERILRVFLTPKDSGFSYARIVHRDVVGALSAITRSLAPEFDIVTSITKIKIQEDENYIELLLRSSKYPNAGQDWERDELVIHTLQSAALDEYELKVGFPSKIGAECELKELTHIPLTENCATGPIFQDETALIIREKTEQLESHLTLKAADRIKKTKQIRVLREIRKYELGSGEIGTNIFVSYNFSEEDYFNAFSSVAAEGEFSIKTGKSPDEKPTMREAIIQRISDCDGFVGIWTGDSESFSPWLLWELAVAQTLSKPFKLLIAPEVPDGLWRKINAESAHYRFNPLEFRREAYNALNALQGQIVDRY